MPVQLDRQRRMTARCSPAGPASSRPRASSSGTTLTPQPASTARTWPSELGTNSWLSDTRFRPKALPTNSLCMSSLRLNAMNGTSRKLCGAQPLAGNARARIRAWATATYVHRAQRHHLAAAQRLLERRDAAQHLAFAQPLLGEILVVGDDLHAASPGAPARPAQASAQVAMLSALMAIEIRSSSRRRRSNWAPAPCRSRSRSARSSRTAWCA